jgi:hypothetical protein
MYFISMRDQSESSIQQKKQIAKYYLYTTASVFGVLVIFETFMIQFQKIPFYWIFFVQTGDIWYAYQMIMSGYKFYITYKLTRYILQETGMLTKPLPTYGFGYQARPPWPGRPPSSYFPEGHEVEQVHPQIYSDRPDISYSAPREDSQSTEDTKPKDTQQ